LRLALLLFTLTFMESPATWIRDGRRSLGLSTRDLARLAGVAYPTISRIENGHDQPRWSTLERIFDVLGSPLTPSANDDDRPRLADLRDAWIQDALGTEHPEWVRFRAFADQLTMRPSLTAQAILPEPPRSGSLLIDTLLAAMAEKIADDAEIARPHWVRDRPPLAEPWSAEVRPSKRAEARANAPAQFVNRGLLIPASAIWRERALIRA
jgi:transcriptional regulator with XRE-family HTH domain